MVEEQFGESADNINNSDLKIRFTAVKKLVPQKHKAVAHVKRADGGQTHTKHEENDAFADYFSGSFRSVRRPFRDIVERERKYLGGRLFAARGGLKETDLIQTEIDLSRRYAKMSPFKAIDEKRVGSELWKYALATMSSLYHPLFLKAAVWIKEPVGWKIGQA